MSGKKFNVIIDKLGFFQSHHVEAVDFSGDIWVSWKETIRVQIVQNHPQFILLKILGNLNSNTIFNTFVYGSPNRYKRKFLWKALRQVIPLNGSPCLFMGDFNIILSVNDKKKFIC